MKTIRYGSYVFYDPKTVGSVRKMVRRFGVKYKSYAGEVLQRIFHFYFGDAINLQKEYRKYYEKEYIEFEDYLECHFGIPKRIIGIISSANAFYVNLAYKGDHIGDSFYYEDDLKELFWNMVGGIQNENSNGLCNEQLFN